MSFVPTTVIFTGLLIPIQSFVATFAEQPSEEAVKRNALYSISSRRTENDVSDHVLIGLVIIAHRVRVFCCREPLSLLALLENEKCRVIGTRFTIIITRVSLPAQHREVDSSICWKQHSGSQGSSLASKK